jgi:hypothetical protein
VQNTQQINKYEDLDEERIKDLHREKADVPRLADKASNTFRPSAYRLRMKERERAKQLTMRKKMIFE